MKHKTANRVIIHVGKNDIRKGQSEMLKQDFSELFETLQRLEVQSFIRHFSAYVLGMSCRHQSMDTCKPGFVIITVN